MSDQGLLFLCLSVSNTLHISSGAVLKFCACARWETTLRNGPRKNSLALATLEEKKCLPVVEVGEVTGGSLAMHHFNGQVLWGSSLTLYKKACDRKELPTKSDGGVCPRIVSRKEWGALKPSGFISHLLVPLNYVIIHHSGGPSCSSERECKKVVRDIQHYHMKKRHFYDIGYNFLVGEDGNVYEGRGWDEEGAQAKGWNTKSIGICVMGNYMNRAPNEAALNTLKRLLQCGMSLNKISGEYILRGHRDVWNTDCPGDRLYAIIQKWPHYTHR